MGSVMTTAKVVKELLERSNRLGSEPRFTNYAGGNTSAKGSVPNPATGHETTVMWVKGSGGDLGTMTESGLAALELDKFNDLKNVLVGLAALVLVDQHEAAWVAQVGHGGHGVYPFEGG